MRNILRLGLAMTVGLLLTMVVEISLLLQQMGVFVWESTVAFILAIQLATSLGLDVTSLRFAMPGLRIQMAGSVSHAHGGALHWTVSVLAGLFVTVVSWQTLAPFLAPGTTVQLGNILGMFITLPIVIPVFVLSTLAFYFLLKKY